MFYIATDKIFLQLLTSLVSQYRVWIYWYTVLNASKCTNPVQMLWKVCLTTGWSAFSVGVLFSQAYLTHAKWTSCLHTGAWNPIWPKPGLASEVGKFRHLTGPNNKPKDHFSNSIITFYEAPEKTGGCMWEFSV